MEILIDGYMRNVKDPETQNLLREKHLRSLSQGYGFKRYSDRRLPKCFDDWIEVYNYIESIGFQEDKFTYYYKCYMEDEYRFWSCKVSFIAIQAFRELKKMHLNYVNLMSERIKNNSKL